MVYLNNLLHKIAIVRITELDSALRIMCFNTLLNNIGSVAMVSTWSVYVTGILKFSTLWLTVSGCAMAAGMMIGSACCGTITDRLEPRSVICASNICFGMCMALLCFITDPAAITILLAMSGLSSSFYHPARSILIVRYTPSDDIATTRSVTASYGYLGTILGTFGSLLALSGNTRSWYIVAIAVNAISSFLVSVSALRLPRIRDHSENKSVRNAFYWLRKSFNSIRNINFKMLHLNTQGAMRDSRFIMTCILMNIPVLALYAFNTGMPVWLVKFTAFPTVLVGVHKAMVNLTGTILHTVLTRKNATFLEGVKDYECAALIQSLAVVLVPVSLFLSQYGYEIAAIFVFCVITALLALTEIAMNGAAWTVSYALRRQGKQGEYEASSNFIDGAFGILYPYITTPLCSSFSMIGWWIVGSISAVGVIIMRLFIKSPSTNNKKQMG